MTTAPGRRRDRATPSVDGRARPRFRPPSLLLGALLGLGLALPGRAAAEYGDPELLAPLAEPAVVESSGLAASRRTPGVLWTHNDSGDGPLLYATDRAGRALGTFAVTGAANVDWEDMAAGPGPSGVDVLYVGDIGDNARQRDDLAVYRVPEPPVDPNRPSVGGQLVATEPAERFPFAYPDGRHDAETLLVHPTSGEVLVVTKETGGPTGVYRFPLPLTPERPAILVEVARVSLPGLVGLARAATGGAVSPDGTRVAIRTYTAAAEWTIAPAQSVAEALTGEPRPVALPATAQGEAIAYRSDGLALLVTSEGVPCPLYEVPANDPLTAAAAPLASGAGSIGATRLSRAAALAPARTPSTRRSRGRPPASRLGRPSPRPRPPSR